MYVDMCASVCVCICLHVCRCVCVNMCMHACGGRRPASGAIHLVFFRSFGVSYLYLPSTGNTSVSRLLHGCWGSHSGPEAHGQTPCLLSIFPTPHNSLFVSIWGAINMVFFPDWNIVMWFLSFCFADSESIIYRCKSAVRQG